MSVDYEKLVSLRSSKGWSQNDLAIQAKVSQQTIGKLETGAAKTSKFLPRIAAALGVSPTELDSDFLLGTALEDGPVHFRPPPQFLGERDLPVFTSAEGGIAGAMVVSTEPIEWVPRPWFMKEVRDGYAVLVTGESMVPVYEPGDMVIVNPRLPAQRGKNAIFVGGEERGEFHATVKRLERSTSEDWHVRQWNPPDGGKQEVVLPKAQWPKALRIVGKYEGG